MIYYGGNDYRDYLAHYGRKGMKWGENIFGDSEVVGYHTKAYLRARKRYDKLLAKARKAGLRSKRSRKKTSYGNIDLDNRAVVDWNDENLEKYKNEYESLGYSKDDLKGSKSTVMGESRNYGGLELALSPLVQDKKGGARMIDSKTIDNYVETLIDKLKKKGEWTTEDLLKADKKGLKIGKQKVNSIIADVGDKARKTAEQMHFLGKDGAIGLQKKQLRREKKKEYNRVLNNIANDVIRGKYGSGDDRKNIIEKSGISYNIVQNRVNKLLGSKTRHKVSAEEKKRTRRAIL